MNREMDITPAERELLTLLRMRPAAYLGNAVGLHSLAKFLDGYRVALIRHNLNDARILPEGFDDYAAKICTGQEAGARRWDSFLLEREPDGERALALFWDLLNAYLEENRCEPIPAPALPPARPMRFSSMRHSPAWAFTNATAATASSSGPASGGTMPARWQPGTMR